MRNYLKLCKASTDSPYRFSICRMFPLRRMRISCSNTSVATDEHLFASEHTGYRIRVTRRKHANSLHVRILSILVHIFWSNSPGELAWSISHLRTISSMTLHGGKLENISVSQRSDTLVSISSKSEISRPNSSLRNFGIEARWKGLLARSERDATTNAFDRQVGLEGYNTYCLWDLHIKGGVSLKSSSDGEHKSSSLETIDISSLYDLDLPKIDNVRRLR
jgi:hypothetical protein